MALAEAVVTAAGWAAAGAFGLCVGVMSLVSMFYGVAAVAILFPGEAAVQPRPPRGVPPVPAPG